MVIPRSSLLKTLKKYRGKKKIVFTNGCYDLLHLGHVRLLEHAKKLGDLLVVGINSDQSVRKLKGPSRPLVPEKDRAELLSSLRCVDYVTVFSEPTPAELIQELHPEILVKGSDYKHDEIVGRDTVKKVVRFPLVKGLSTTNLIEKIVKSHRKGL